VLRDIIAEKVLDNNRLLSITRQNSSVASIGKPQAGNLVTQAQQTDLSSFPKQEVKAKSEKVSSSVGSQKVEESKTPSQPQHNSKPQP
jgi:hypothetical protein